MSFRRLRFGTKSLFAKGKPAAWQGKLAKYPMLLKPTGVKKTGYQKIIELGNERTMRDIHPALSFQPLKRGVPACVGSCVVVSEPFLDRFPVVGMAIAR